MINKRFPKYPDDADYNTNSPSYYDDLARKQKLIQLLAERIWEYENTLNESLEQIEKRLTEYILENDLLMNERLENWDKRIDEMPEEMQSLFVTWLNDGTLEQIINHDVLGNKADKSFVDTEIEKVTTHLEQNIKENRDARFRTGVITTASFLVDDGYIGDYDILKPISEQTGVPFTLAVVTNDMDNDSRIFSHVHMDKLHELVDDYGFEVASHTHDHLRLSDETYQTQENQLRLSKEKIEEYGFTVNSIVYPYGAYNNNTLKIAPKYYSHGFRAGTGGINDSPIETYLLHRIQFDPTNPNNNFEWYKARIDEANAQNKWIVFMLHTSAQLNWLDVDQQQLLIQVINYMKSLGIPIKTTGETFKQFRNIYETSDGLYRLGAKPYQEYLPTNSDIDINTPIGKFPYGVSYKTFTTIDDQPFPLSRGGTLITFNWSPRWEHSFQVWKAFNFDEIRMRRLVSIDEWGAFSRGHITDVEQPTRRLTWETGHFEPFETKTNSLLAPNATRSDYPIANPIASLPTGIVFNVSIETDGEVTLKLTNVSNATINNFSRSWNIRVLKG